MIFRIKGVSYEKEPLLVPGARGVKELEHVIFLPLLKFLFGWI